MNERLRVVRAHAGMNQFEFARALGIGQSTLAMMETGKREIHERHIKTICAIFCVNEHWFRTGEGEAFTDESDNVVQFSASHPNMSDVDKAVMEAYFSLSEEQKEAFLQYCLNVAEAWKAQNGKKNTAAPELSGADLHAELDRQIQKEKTAEEESGAS